MSAIYHTNAAFLDYTHRRDGPEVLENVGHGSSRSSALQTQGASTRSDEPRKIESSSKPGGSSSEGTHCYLCRCRGAHPDVDEKSLLESYVESATIHGVAQMQASGPSHYILRRPIWFLLIFAMATALSVTLFHQISHYYDYPIKTSTRVTLNTELPFPTVTVCNLNQYMRDRVPDIPVVKHVLYYFSEYVKYKLHTDNATQQVPDLDNLTDVSGEELRRIMHHAAPRISEFLRICWWDSRPHDCTTMFRTVETIHGTCFVFNGPEDEHHHMASGSWSALKFVAHIENEKSYFSRHLHAGIKVIVHERNATPSADHDGWFMRPGVAASITLSKFETKSLAWPYKAYSNGYCEDTEVEGYLNKLQDFPTYSAAQCLTQCQLNRTRERCGCQHFFAPGNFRVCSAKQMLTCLLPASASIQADDLKTCDCPKECKDVAYEADLSYADFASRFIEEQATKDSLVLIRDQLRENMVEVVLSFKSMNVFQVIQDPGITPSSVLGTVGGQMGLFLGASLLTITELAEVLLLLLLTALRRCVVTRR